MKKLATFIVAALFALAIVFTVVNSAHQIPATKSGSAFASIIPVPPPLGKDKKDTTAK